MKLNLLLKEECLLIKNSIKDKESVLKTIAKLAKQCSFADKTSEDEIYQALKHREELGSTGLENKIAIPHCSLKNLEDFIVGILIVPDGLDYQSLDGEKSSVFIFILAPESKRTEHIRILSAVSSVLQVKGVIDNMIHAENILDLKEKFLQHANISEDSNEEKEFHLIQVVIQSEEKFEEILHLFTELENCSISILESKNASDFLYHMPLFSSFWTHEQKGFQRTIIGLVEKCKTNHLIRKINKYIEPKDNNDVLVFIQNILYSNGSINI